MFGLSAKNRQWSGDDNSCLPAELLNNFYVDVIVIHSRTDEELANTFISNVRSRFQTEDEYIIVSYLDRRLSDGADGFSVDYKRCSVAVYLFTKKSVEEYHGLTEHPYLQELMYKNKLIPVLTLPKEELDISMAACVPVPLLYYNKKASECPYAMLELLKNNIEIRRMKERSHTEKRERYLRDNPRDIQKDCPGAVKENPPGININANTVIVGNNTLIYHSRNTGRNKESKHTISKTDLTESLTDNTIQLDRGCSYSDSCQDEPGRTQQNTTESIQTPYASMSSSSEENFASNSSFSNEPQRDSGKHLINHVSYGTPRGSNFENAINDPSSNPVPKAISGEYFTWNSAFSNEDRATNREEMSHENISTNSLNHLPRPQKTECEIRSFPSTVSVYPSMDAPVTNDTSTNQRTTLSPSTGSTNGDAGQNKQANMDQKNVERPKENKTLQRNMERSKENKPLDSSQERRIREKAIAICDPKDSLFVFAKGLGESLRIDSLFNND